MKHVKYVELSQAYDKGWVNGFVMGCITLTLVVIFIGMF